MIPIFKLSLDLTFFPFFQPKTGVISKLLPNVHHMILRVLRSRITLAMRTSRRWEPESAIGNNSITLNLL